MARRTATAEIEVFPEVDRLDDFPHPRETAKLFGHRAAQSDLVQAFQSGRMHHGWIITGADGIGKATLAYQFATLALSPDGERNWSPSSGFALDRDSPTARQVRQLSHPACSSSAAATTSRTSGFPRPSLSKR